MAHRSPGTKIKIALLADIVGWAHHIIAINVKKFLPPEFETDIFYLFKNDYREEETRSIHFDKYDIVHLMSWRHWYVIKNWNIQKSKLVTTLHGHRGTKGNNWERYRMVFNHFAAVSAVSKKLLDEFKNDIPNLALIPCGIDTQLFYPDYTNKNAAFTFGAVGRYYQNKRETDDIKGWNEILEPLSRQLPTMKSNYIKSEYASEISYQEMPQFYHSCDCFLCASKTEGNPLPLLEAAACGLPLISTDVGIASEIIVPGHNGYIIERDKEEFKEVLIRLSQSKETCTLLGESSRKIMLASRDWSVVIPRWVSFYKSIL